MRCHPIVSSPRPVLLTKNFSSPRLPSLAKFLEQVQAKARSNLSRKLQSKRLIHSKTAFIPTPPIDVLWPRSEAPAGASIPYGSSFYGCANRWGWSCGLYAAIAAARAGANVLLVDKGQIGRG